MLVVGLPVQPEELQEIEVLTMSVTAYGESDILGDLDLDHSRLIIDQLRDGQYNLVDVLLVYLLAVLESLYHIIDELLCHFASEFHTIVVSIDSDRVHIKALGRRWPICNLDSGEEIELAHNLLALDELEFGILVARVDLCA